MNRISRDQLYMEVAQLFAKRSTCFRANVGAVIVHDNLILSTAYNGAPAGEEHCLGQDCPLNSAGGCSKSVHAEINAIKHLALDPCGIAKLTLYITHSPCTACAKAIIETKRFEKVFYNTKYRIKMGIDMLLESGIKVYRMTASGYVIDESTDTLLV